MWLCVSCSKNDDPTQDEFIDPNFIELLHTQYHVPLTSEGKIDLNDEKTQFSLKAIVQLTINEPLISDLTGIRNLASLDELNMKCDVKTLDISGMKYLTTLICRDGKLEHLNIRDTPLLEELYLDDNLLTYLDLSGHPKINTIYCSDNRLRTLDVKDLTNLEKLICYRNHLSTLDASQMILHDYRLVLQCGRQTDENGGKQTLHLTLSEKQRKAWNDGYGSSYINENINVTFIP